MKKGRLLKSFFVVGVLMFFFVWVLAGVIAACTKASINAQGGDFSKWPYVETIQNDALSVNNSRMMCRNNLGYDCGLWGGTTKNHGDTVGYGTCYRKTPTNCWAESTCSKFWYAKCACASNTCIGSSCVDAGWNTCAGTKTCCIPETNAAFCSRLGKNCGSVTANDNCGTSRTVTCGTCSGNCNSYCSGGVCQDTAAGTDPYGICNGGYYCDGNTIEDGGLCGLGTGCVWALAVCYGGENSRCVSGQISCKNLCSNGVDDDGDGYTDGQDSDCGGGSQCTSGTCCDTATGRFQPTTYQPSGTCNKCTGSQAAPVFQTNSEDKWIQCSIGSDGSATSCQSNTCSGTSAACGYLSSGTTCRTSKGNCDVLETCIGSAYSCPGDSKFGSSTTCRAAGDWCNPAEVCDGTNNVCPGDVQRNGQTCRGSAGVCDSAESCSGGTCPADSFNSSTTTCSLRSSWYCNSPSQRIINVTKCSGNTASCPASTPANLAFDYDSCLGSTFCNEETGICMSTGITDAYWAKLNGDRVSSANVNDTLLMMVIGGGLGGKSINYSIYKSSWLPWMTITNTENSIGSTSYKPEEVREYKFRARIEAMSVQKDSLSISINVASNSLPIAVINLPVNELNISNGTNINFNQSSYDEDDLLKITWDFGDGTNYTITNYINNSNPDLARTFNITANAIHNYSSSGRYTVKLTAEEMIRGQKSESSIIVNVFKTGINVVPVISSLTRDVSYTSMVRFNASRSFVANCSTICPSVQSCFSVGTNFCYYIHAPGKKVISGYNLKMEWAITGDTPHISISGNWSNYSGVVDFVRHFPIPKQRQVKLIMRYS